MTPFSNTALHLYGIYTMKEEYKFLKKQPNTNPPNPQKQTNSPPAPTKTRYFGDKG